jgi:putative tryptophan/tyrosine transport system substrate-binding protein
MLVAGVPATWSFMARAQQANKPLAGFLNAVERDDRPITSFRRGLSELGYVDGENVSIEFRFADGRYHRLASLAAELVSLPVNLIVTVPNSPPALAAKAVTSTIPIVFFVASLDPMRRFAGPKSRAAARP